MIDKVITLKAIADETRMELLIMLLNNNCCVKALARRLGLTQATISQHLKVLREVGLLTGEKRGYFTYYNVNRTVLQELAGEIEALAAIQLTACTPGKPECKSTQQDLCHAANSECGCGKVNVKQ